MASTDTGRYPQGVDSPQRAQIPQKTLREDRWWLQPFVTFVCFSAWLLYGLIRASLQTDYFVADYGYLTPFASPCLSTSCVPGSTHFGTPFGEWPALIPFAALTLPFLLLFRLTCYYYRKAYYRSFWLSPPACAVPDSHAGYSGETRLPLIGQNLHRYFFYAAVLISVINTYDLIRAFRGGDGGFGIGLGTLVLLVNVVMLWTYTISCHSCRHITGGRLKHFSAHPVRYRIWTFVSRLNTRHMELAWITLGTLALTDFYVMAVAAGWFDDLRFIN